MDFFVQCTLEKQCTANHVIKSDTLYRGKWPLILNQYPVNCTSIFSHFSITREINRQDNKKRTGFSCPWEEDESLFIFYYLSLQVFLCAGNPVRYIHPDAFKGLLVLQHLRLRSSQLQQLPSLLHIGHSLLYFELIHSMQVKENQARDFSYLRKIERIAMIYGVLKCTPLGLNHIANIVKDFELCSNGIRSIASMEGVKFIRLRRIYLYDNSIT